MSTDPKSTYYDRGGVQVIDIIRAKLTSEQYRGYLLGNVLKYAARLEWKGARERDAEKLRLYAMWLHEELAPPPPERQEQVRERHDVVPVWQQPGFVGEAQDVQHHSPVPAGWRPISTAPTDGTVIEVLTDETELPAIQAKVAYHPDAGWTVDGLRETLYWRPLSDQRPPDRHSAAHCPDGGACKHKCGLEPCKSRRP